MPGLRRQPTQIIRGFQIFEGFLDLRAQESLVQDLRTVVAAAPLFSPQTPYGKRMSVRMTSAGRYGWFSDQSGYRYTPRHPSGVPARPLAGLR